jgi:hypothetical protein
MSLILTIPLNQNQFINVFQGTFGKYYNINELKESDNLDGFPIYYDIHYPLEWVINNENSGPTSCSNCKNYGFYKGVFIGYCLNCAMEHNYYRGNGMTIHKGQEINNFNQKEDDFYEYKSENSIWNTYLQNVELNEIGDKQLEDDFEMYKDLPPLIPIYKESDSINYESSDYGSIDYESSDYDLLDDIEERKFQRFKDWCLEKD